MKADKNSPTSAPAPQNELDTNQKEGKDQYPKASKKAKPEIPRKPSASSPEETSLVKRRIAALESTTSNSNDAQPSPTLPSPQKKPPHRVMQGDALYTQVSKTPSPHTSENDSTALSRSQRDSGYTNSSSSYESEVEGDYSYNKLHATHISPNSSGYSSLQITPPNSEHEHADVFVEEDNMYEEFDFNTTIPAKIDIKTVKTELMDCLVLIQQLQNKKIATHIPADHQDNLKGWQETLIKYTGFLEAPAMNQQDLEDHTVKLKEFKHSISLIAAETLLQQKKTDPAFVLTVFKGLQLEQADFANEACLLAAQALIRSKDPDPILTGKAFEELEINQIETLLPNKKQRKKLPTDLVKIINGKLIKKYITQQCIDNAPEFSNLFRVGGQASQYGRACDNLSTELIIHSKSNANILLNNPENNLASAVKRLLREKYAGKNLFSAESFQKVSDSLSASDKILFDDMVEVAYSACEKACNLAPELSDRTVWEPHPMHKTLLSLCLEAPAIEKSIYASPEEKKAANNQAKDQMSAFMNAWRSYTNQTF